MEGLRIIVKDHILNGIDNVWRLIDDLIHNDMHDEIDRLAVACGADGEIGRGLVGVLARHHQNLSAHRGGQGTWIRVADNAVSDVFIRVVRVGGHAIEIDLKRLRIVVEHHILHGIDNVWRQVRSRAATVEVVHAEIGRRNHAAIVALRRRQAERNGRHWA